MKKVFLEISQNSQEKTRVRVYFLNEVAGQWGWIKESEKKAKQAESLALLREGEAQHQTLLVIYKKRQVFKEVYLQRAWV